MGRIRTVFIKSLSNRLIERYPDKCTTDFENNKKVVGELTNIESKHIRNRVAGYIAHNMNKLEKFKTLKISYQMEDKRKGRGGRGGRGRR